MTKQADEPFRVEPPHADDVCERSLLFTENVPTLFRPAATSLKRIKTLIALLFIYPVTCYCLPFKSPNRLYFKGPLETPCNKNLALRPIYKRPSKQPPILNVSSLLIEHKLELYFTEMS